MTPQVRKAEQFRALHAPGKPFVLFNIWDAGSAKVVAASGAKAIGTGSWSVAKANGFADGEQIPVSLVIDNLRRIVQATELPITVDLESGYGDSPSMVARTVAWAICAGAVGCNLEDRFPSDGSLRELSDQAERIHYARQVADASDVPFFINARTDVFFQAPAEQHDEDMLTVAIARARAYAKAGADGIFVPGLTNLALIARFVERVWLPVNIMVGEAGPSLHTLAARGIARVSYGPHPYRVAMKTLEMAAREANA